MLSVKEGKKTCHNEPIVRLNYEMKGLRISVI